MLKTSLDKISKEGNRVLFRNLKCWGLGSRPCEAMQHLHEAGGVDLGATGAPEKVADL